MRFSTKHFTLHVQRLSLSSFMITSCTGQYEKREQRYRNKWSLATNNMEQDTRHLMYARSMSRTGGHVHSSRVSWTRLMKQNHCNHNRHKNKKSKAQHKRAYMWHTTQQGMLSAMIGLARLNQQCYDIGYGSLHT